MPLNYLSIKPGPIDLPDNFKVKHVFSEANTEMLADSILKLYKLALSEKGKSFFVEGDYRVLLDGDYSFTPRLNTCAFIQIDTSSERLLHHLPIHPHTNTVGLNTEFWEIISNKSDIKKIKVLVNNAFNNANDSTLENVETRINAVLQILRNYGLSEAKIEVSIIHPNSDESSLLIFASPQVNLHIFERDFEDDPWSYVGIVF